MAAERPPMKCVVADDHPGIVSSVCDVLADAGFEIAGRASNGEEALAKIEQYHPDLAVLDLRMPKLTGIEVARRADVSSPQTAIILYTASGDRALVSEAVDVGIQGFVLKEAPLQDLVRAAAIVAEGGSFIDPLVVGLLVTSATRSKATQLTQREREVLRLLADGLSNEQIGKSLYISPETVRTHIRKAMKRLEADTRTQAVAKAIRESLIE